MLKEKQQKDKEILRSQTRPYAVAFGLLAATVGILAGGHPVPMVGLGAAFALLYLLAERRGWLLASPEGRIGRETAVTATFAALVVLFVYLTGGLRSPMPCALYLPVLLAALCYGMRLGLAASLAMIAAAAILAMDGRLPHSAISMRAVAIGLSFPVVALFGGAMRAQMESRLRVLSSETRDLSAQLDMSQMMDAAFDLDMTLNLILLNIQQHTDCAVCAVYLSAPDGRTLELRAAGGPRRSSLLLPALPVDEARHGGWSVTDTVRGDLDVRAFYAPDARPGVSPETGLFAVDRSAASFACLPLASVEGLLGMLYVGFPQPQGLSPEAVSRLEHLTARAVFPLQRVLLQHDFRSLAYSDAMTGLDNFRQFEENLAEELSRSERYERPLSVILLDIDHFKAFNDTLGHQAGDALLGQLGVVLRNSLRNVDKPARYGGEEFVIICPETGSDEAQGIAERIRRSVADTVFVLPNKDGSKEGGKDEAGTSRVTISLGCATYPLDARTPRDLVKKADIALYDAKAAGRNTVRAYIEDGVRVKAA